MSTQPITHEDTVGAALITVTKDRMLMRRAATSPHSSSVTRFAVAMNEGIDRGLLVGLLNDPAPHVAELAAARLAGMDSMERMLLRRAKSDAPNPVADRFMDAEGAAVVRHLTGHQIEILTVSQADALIRHTLARKGEAPAQNID